MAKPKPEQELGRLSAYPPKSLLEDFQETARRVDNRSGAAQTVVLMQHYVDANRDHPSMKGYSPKGGRKKS